ncbi:MAG: HU family DNA-binding protein [Bacteroides sp.]|nr:HU family DNA-binding protein [Bacteroides sp.]
MDRKMNIQDIIELFIKEYEIEPDKAQAFATAFFDTIVEGLEQDGFVKIKGLGTFKLVTVESRESINVNTGERIEIPSYTKVSFIPESTLRDRINKPFEHFETVILSDELVLDQEIEESENEEKEEDEEAIVVPVLMDAPLDESTDLPMETLETVDQTESLTEIQNEVDETEPIEDQETPQSVADDTENKLPEETGSKAQTYLIALIIVVLLLCSLVLLFLYNSDFICKYFSHDTTTPPVIIEQPSRPPVTSLDTLVTDTLPAGKTAVDSTKLILPVKVEMTPPSPRKRNPALIPVHPDSTSYDIIGTKTTYKLQPGETLIRVSLRFYNTKDLWPYLYKYNRDLIKNPDKVPTGLTIKIPELKKKD